MIAHVTDVGGGGGGGSGLRFLLLIGGMGVIAVAARLRAAKRTSQPWLPWMVGVIGVAMAVAGLVVPAQKDPKIYLTLLQPDPGAVVPANQDFDLEVNVEGAKLAPTPTAKEGGHLHLYVDDKLQSMPYGTKVSVRLPPGPHTLKVEFVDEKHVAYDPPIEVETSVTAQ